MTLARGTNIANALVTELNDSLRPWHVPAAQFTAARSYAPIYTRETIGSTIRCDVVTLENDEAGADTDDGPTPRTRQDDYAINVVITAAVADLTSNAEIDALVYLVQQIHDWFERKADGTFRKFASISPPAWVADVKVPALYDPDELIDNGLFICPIELTARQRRKPAGGTP